MTLRAFLGWLAFVLYLGLFVTVPPTLLYEGPGFVTGIIVTLCLLLYLRIQGTRRIAARLNLIPLSPSEYPAVHAIVNEYSRRLGIPAPKLGILETPVLNIALWGFSHRNAYLAISRGSLERMSRETLASLIGRQMAYLWHGDIFAETWLSQFLSLMDQFVAPSRSRVPTHARRNYPFRLFFRQIVLYPLAFFPVAVLRSAREPKWIDERSIRLTRKPRSLAEGLRALEAMNERIPFHAPFSTRHLFLVPPPAHDPLARIFFGTLDLSERVKGLEMMTHVVSHA